MSKKEREQLIVFEQLKTRVIKQGEAALKLGLSTRWIRIKFDRYVEFGAQGLIHKRRGVPGAKGLNDKERALLVNLLQNEWAGFGPTFTTEKLLELHGIKTNKESVRQEMIKAGLWVPKAKRKKHRKRRERREYRGIMIQLDGSPHDWFEGRGPKCTLLVYIDDATSELMWLEFVKSESHGAVMGATKKYIEHHGRPHEFYVDCGSVFRVNLNNHDCNKKTQWERALEELGIKVIHAHSPQSKGRVERSNGTMQDRLVKEMRLAGVSSIKEANHFLRTGDFIAKHNKRFAVPPAKEGNVHRPADCYDLKSIFCLKEERVVANDYTVTFKKKIFQLMKTLSARPKDHVTVNTHLDGKITLTIRKVNLEYAEIQNRPEKKPQEEQIKPFRIFKPSENSKRWNQGKLPINISNSIERRVE